MVGSETEPKQQDEFSGRYMTPRQVAEFLGKSADWVRRRVADGTMPHRYVGRDLRFVPSEVREWVDQQTRERNGEAIPTKKPGAH